MLGFISREMFDAEKEWRIRAEARADELVGRVADLKAMLDGFQPFHKHEMQKQREIYEKQIQELQARIQEYESAPPTPVKLEDMTAEEIMRIPATSKREMFVRRMRAADARIREDNRTAEEARARRMAHLTPEERRANMTDFDDTLGVFLEREVLQVEDAVNNDHH